MHPAIDADAFDHGGTQEFAVISAVVVRHNQISNILGIVAQHRRHRQRPPPAHLRALGRRSGKSLVRDRKRPKGKAFPRKAYTDIPAVVDAMRQYWMPIRFHQDS